MRWAAALLLMSSALAHADPYPAQIVRRAPWLPEGTTEASAAFRAILPDFDHAFGAPQVFDLDVHVRHALEYVEPFVGVRLRYDRYALDDPYYDQYYQLDTLQALDAGVRVPISCLSDLALRMSWIAPTHRLFRGFETDLSYEWRVWLSPTWGLAGDVGTTFRHEDQIFTPVRPDDPVDHLARWLDWMHARIGVDVQSPGPIALEAGLHLGDDGALANHDYYLALTYATSPLDAVVQIAVEPFDYSNTWIVTTAGAFRF